MRVTRVEPVVLRCPVGPPETGRTRDWVNVLVHTDEGITGFGRGGDVGVIAGDLAPLLVDSDPRNIASLWDRMYEAVWRYRGPNRAGMSSVGAVDVALWDLYGKVCGQPVWRLLGGFKDTVPAYADGIDFSDQSPQAVAAKIEAHQALGFDAFKLHFHRSDPQEVLEKVRLCREVIGPDKRLMIDVWRAWPGPLAVDMVKKLEPFDLYWIEEPVRHDDEPMYMRMVQANTTALVTGGEAEGTLFGVRRLLNEGALQVVQTDILEGGGYTGLRKIAALAEAYHLPFAPHGAQYPDINCHMVAAVPNGFMVSTCPHVEDFQIWSKLYAPPFRVEDGRIAMTEKPGLGLDLDREFIDRYRV